jgi:Flp pilus assembly CpaE family ATPase
VLDLVQIGRAKTHVVLNRANRGSGGVRRTDVEATLGLPVWAVLPNDDAVAVRAANQGLTIAQTAPGSRLGRALALLARQLVPENTERRSQVGLLRTARDSPASTR